MAEPEHASPDAYSRYEAGLSLLLDRLGHNHPRFTEALTYQQRLLENIAQTRQHGDTENLRHERSRVVDLLNQLAMEAVGVSFNELCGLQLSPEPVLPIAPSPAEAREWRDLGILLGKVKQFWVEGVLEKSLHNVALLELGKEIDVEAVEHPWERVLELPDQTQTLPPDKRILDIFEKTSRALLILGEPGSGKTITLLELTRDLIAHAEKDETFSQPIPLVLNLSSWQKGQSLIDWLVAELSAKYQIPKRIGRPWLENNRLLPLLDGLDEVKAENRAACVEAINHFSEEFGLAGLVVCSRLKEYTELPVRLKFNGAIRLQPLTSEQVDEYLIGAGSKLEALRVTLQRDNTLRTLAQSPLMLNIMSLAYQDVSAELLTDQLTVGGHRKQLFDSYIERMFKRRGTGDRPYDDRQSTAWLSFLAQKMTEHNQTIFLIEKLQPSCLSSRPWRWTYALGSRLIVGLIFGLILGLILGLIGGLIFGLIGGLSVGLIDALRFERGSKNITLKKAPPYWQSASNVLVVALNVGLIAVLIYGLIHGLIVGLGVGLIVGLIFGLIFGLRGSRLSLSNDIQTVEALSWSWGEARKGIARGLIYGLIVALIVGLIGGLVLALRSGLIFGLISGLIVGLIYGLIFGLIGGLFGAIFSGLRSSIVGTKTTPNQGIQLSLRNAISTGLIFGLIGGLTFGLIFGLTSGLTGGPNFGLTFGLTGGLFFGLSAALWYGGLDIIQHFTLRFILCRNGHIPWNYARFLDYAAERIFLRKVGGGYIFVHRLLMEYFAELEDCLLSVG